MNEPAGRVLSGLGVDAAGFTAHEQLPGVWTGVVPGARAAEIWEALRAAYPHTGLWPILRGDPDEEKEVGSDHDPAAELEHMESGGIREILDFRFQQRCADISEYVEGVDEAEGFEGTAARFDGAAEDELEDDESDPPDADEPLSFASAERSPGRPLRQVELALLRIAHPWEATIALGFGEWNDCPPARTIAAAMREWEKAWGAVPACITRDVIECVVDRPPTGEADCMAVAAEQWILCEDIVTQGTQMVARLARELRGSRQWYFWWD